MNPYLQTKYDFTKHEIRIVFNLIQEIMLIVPSHRRYSDIPLLSIMSGLYQFYHLSDSYSGHQLRKCFTAFFLIECTQRYL